MELMGAQGREHRLCFRTQKLEANWPMLKTQLCHNFMVVARASSTVSSFANVKDHCSLF